MYFLENFNLVIFVLHYQYILDYLIKKGFFMKFKITKYFDPERLN